MFGQSIVVLLFVGAIFLLFWKMMVVPLLDKHERNEKLDRERLANELMCESYNRPSGTGGTEEQKE